VHEHVAISDSMQSPLSLLEFLHVLDTVAVSTSGGPLGSSVVI